MRRAMICVSLMLALVQLWPMVFGERLPSTMAEAAPRHITAAPHTIELKPYPAVALVTPKVRPTSYSVPETCYQHYQRAFKACDVNSQACHLGAADHWDLCEATGFWKD